MSTTDNDEIRAQRVQRNRPLTEEEAEKYRKLREQAGQVRQEYEAGNLQVGPMKLRDWYDLEFLFADLKKARQQQGLSLEQLAERSGISASVLDELEKGTPPRDPTIHTLMKWARGLGLKLGLMLSEVPERVESK